MKVYVGFVTTNAFSDSRQHDAPRFHTRAQMSAAKPSFKRRAIRIQDCFYRDPPRAIRKVKPHHFVNITSQGCMITCKLTFAHSILRTLPQIPSEQVHPSRPHSTSDFAGCLDQAAMTGKSSLYLSKPIQRGILQRKTESNIVEATGISHSNTHCAPNPLHQPSDRSS